MKKMMIADLWGMMIAWSLFLNGCVVVSIALVLCADLILALIKGEVDHWRVSALTIGSYAVMSGLLFMSNIPYYFPNLHIFLAASILNGALIGEYCYLYKRGLAALLSSATGVFMIMLALIIKVFAGEDHTIFSLNSLYLMDLLIFLPHMIPCLACFFSKSAKTREQTAIIRKRAID
jgi:hypothetical protein